jgi:Fe-S cluster assembly protein SufD
VSNALLAAAVRDEGKVSLETSLECAKGISGAEAEQNSKIVLFSPNAVGRLKPSQFVTGDGIKAAHGAAIGGPDRDALFYLESRGIEIDEAVDMLRESLIAAPFAGMGNEKMRAEFERLVRDQL